MSEGPEKIPELKPPVTPPEKPPMSTDEREKELKNMDTSRVGAPIEPTPTGTPSPSVSKEALKRKADREKEAAECLSKAQDILKEFDGQASNIPVHHNYWGLMNRYRALMNQ